MSKDRASLFAPRETADVARRAVRGGVLSVIAQAVRGVIEGAATILLAHTLVPEEFGLVDMIVSATGVVSMLKDAGLSSATIQRDVIDHSQVSLLFWLNTAIGTVLTLVIMAMAPLLAYAYGRPELLSLTLALSFTTLLGAISVQHQALLRRDLRFGSLVSIETVGSLLSSGGAVVFALRGHGAWALVARQLIKFASQAVCTWVLCRWRPGPPRRADVRELVRFGTDVSAFQLVNYLERNLDNVIVGRFAGPAALGLYTTAYGLMRIPIDQINSFSNVCIPALSRMVGSPVQYVQAFRSVSGLVMLLSVPLAPLSIFSAPWFIPALLGEQWTGSVPIFQWLAATLVVKPLMNSGSWLFFSQGRTRELRRYGFIAAALAIGSFVVGLPWGAEGVAISYALVEILVRTPMFLVAVTAAGPVKTRDILATAAPAWACGAIIAVVYPLVAHALRSTAPGLRTGVSLVVSLLVGASAVWAMPWSRRVLGEGPAMLRTMKAEKKDHVEDSTPS